MSESCYVRKLVLYRPWTPGSGSGWELGLRDWVSEWRDIFNHAKPPQLISLVV